MMFETQNPSFHRTLLTDLPHELVDIQDASFDEISQLNRAVKFQSLLMAHFSTHWKHEYFTSLTEVHRASGNNNQEIKVRDVVLVHDDSLRISCKMAAVEELIIG